jgi:hypothetical protein
VGNPRSVALVTIVVASLAGSGAACDALTGIGSLTESTCAPDCGGTGEPFDAGDAKMEADAASSDVDAARDAPFDAASDTSGDGSRDWCAMQDASYRLCSDFDLPDASVLQGFDLGLVPVPYGEGGSFELDPDSSVSPPQSGLGIANPFPSGETSGDRLEGTLWPFGPTPATVECTLQWNPHQISKTTNDYAHVAAISVYSDALGMDEAVNLSVQLHGDGTLIFLESYNSATMPDVPHPIALDVDLDTWYEVQMTFTTSKGVTSYVVRVNNAAASGSTLTQAIPLKSSMVLAVGPAYYAGNTDGPSPGWIFGYDNVICY